MHIDSSKFPPNTAVHKFEEFPPGEHPIINNAKAKIRNVFSSPDSKFTNNPPILEPKWMLKRPTDNPI